MQRPPGGSSGRAWFWFWSHHRAKTSAEGHSDAGNAEMQKSVFCELNLILFVTVCSFFCINLLQCVFHIKVWKVQEHEFPTEYAGRRVNTSGHGPQLPSVRFKK